MQPEVRALQDDALVAAVARVVGVEPRDLRSLGGFESFVYETVVAGEPMIVKATWHERRTPEHVGAELHFVDYLADGGAPVCRAVPLSNGDLIRTVPAKTGAFHVYAFEKAPGAYVARDARTDEHWVRTGALVGQLHRLSTEYPGPPPPQARPTWETEYAEIAGCVAGDGDLSRRFRATLDAIRALPRKAGAFGAIHTDLHSHNIYWRDGEPRVFDFDDMLQFWFVADLAIVLFYAVMNPMWNENNRRADYDRLYELLLRGYATEHALSAESLAALPVFLDLREQTLHAITLRSIPEADWSPGWKQFMEESGVRIRAGRPALDLELR